MRIRTLGMSILLVEWNSRKALMISHRAYVLQTGNIVMESASAALTSDAGIKKAYLGGITVKL